MLALWDGGSVTVNLEAGRVYVVGRALECDVRVSHPSVSRRHFEIVAGPPFRLRDLGSANGIRLFGTPVPSGAELPLPNGAIVEFGEATLVLQGASSEKSTSTNPMDQVARLIDVVAPSALNVLVIGETGAG